MNPRRLTSAARLENLNVVPVEAIEPRSLSLSPDDLALLLEALDSHEYWQVGVVLPRNEGMVWIPGDCVEPFDRYWQDEQPTEKQADAIEQVRRCRQLSERLRLAFAGE